MAKIKLVQTDFTTGEISPKMIARTDIESFKHGAKEITNAYPLPHGACTSRRGTIFVDEVRNSAYDVKFIPFIYSRTESYVLVFNDGYCRFLKNGAYILSGGVPYEIAIPYGNTEYDKIRFTQVGNLLYLVHPKYPPKQIIRTSDTNWAISNISFIYRAVTDQWYENAFIKFKIISGTTAFKQGDNFTIAAPAGTVVDPAPTNTGNGTIVSVSIKSGAPTESWTVTCSYADSSRQEWTVSGSVSGTLISLWNTNNYPQTVVFHEQRLYFGGTPTDPQTIWGSAIGIYNQFTLGPKDNDALQFTIASNQYDEMINLSSGRYLIPFTYGGEFAMMGSTTTGITPSTVRIMPQTYHGSSNMIPLKIGKEILFCQRDNKKIRAVSYSIAEDANTAPDISVLAEHLLARKVKEATFAQDPDYVSWWVMEDGSLLSCVHMRDFSMTGWSKHTTDGLYKNIVCIPESNQDTVYMIIERTVNEETKKYIEYFDYQNNIYSDCSLIGTAITPTKVWSGLSHLEGKTVAIVADDIVQTPKTVVDGEITIDTAASTVKIGLQYSPLIKLHHPVIQNELGTSQAGQLSINKIIVNLQDTIGLKINNIEIPFRKVNVNTLDTPIPMFSGVKQIKNFGWSTEENIVLEQPYPLPWTILSTTIHVNSND